MGLDRSGRSKIAPITKVIQKIWRKRRSCLAKRKAVQAKKTPHTKAVILCMKKVYECGKKNGYKSIYTLYCFTHTHLRTRKTIKILIGYFQSGWYVSSLPPPFFLFSISFYINFVKRKIKYKIGQNTAQLLIDTTPFPCVGCCIIQPILCQGQL